MSSTESNEGRAPSVEKIFANPELPEDVEKNDIDQTTPIQEYPSHLKMSNLGGDDHGVMVGEGGRSTVSTDIISVVPCRYTWA
ncbi:unnamed protein product [Prunus armeniaca]